MDDVRPPVGEASARPRVEDRPGPAAPPLPLSFSTSLAFWLPFLWNRVLFAGGSRPEEGPWRWSSVLGLLLVPAALLYPSLGFALLEPDEGRYAEIPREMLARGEWVVPYLQGEPYLDKPPLFYWCVMASYRAFGLQVWAARLVPALAVHAAVLVLYFLGRRSLGERTAFRGALLLALAPGFLSVGRLLLLDGLLALWTTLALFAAFEAVRTPRFQRGWWLLAAVASGLGVLTKGPVALVLVLVPLLLQRLLARSGCAVGRRAWAVFLGVVLLVTLPWYLALAVREPEFVRYFFWEHHVLRFMTSFAHEHGVWYYGPIVLLGLLPGSLLAVPFVRFLLTGDEEAAWQRTTELGFVLLAGGWTVLFFSLSSCKLPTYVLPAFPPLALALGHFLTHTSWRASRLPQWTAGGFFVLLLAGHHVLLPWYAGYRSPLLRRADLARLCADPRTPVVSYSRSCDSVAFHLRRDDLRNFRSRDIEELRSLVRAQRRTVILCTHRHSLAGLRELLPPEVRLDHALHLALGDVPLVPRRWMRRVVRLLGETAGGLCDVVVVECPAPNPEFYLPRLPAHRRPALLEADEAD